MRNFHGADLGTLGSYGLNIVVGPSGLRKYTFSHYVEELRCKGYVYLKV